MSFPLFSNTGLLDSYFKMPRDLKRDSCFFHKPQYMFAMLTIKVWDHVSIYIYIKKKKSKIWFSTTSSSLTRSWNTLTLYSPFLRARPSLILIWKYSIIVLLNYAIFIMFIKWATSWENLFFGIPYANKKGADQSLLKKLCINLRYFILLLAKNFAA